ncbi:MAG: hypothetical protein Q3Y17_01750 [Blautia sp.]|nr:hypothetical protein [Blautia marasmi]MDR3891336.1 hypothetical protein [Blautia sp.]
MRYIYSSGRIQMNTNGKAGNMNRFIFCGSKKRKRRIKHGK